MACTRRHFIQGVSALGLLAALGRLIPWRGGATPAVQPGTLVGASSRVGHKLWKNDFPAATETTTKDIVIIGGGIAGLAAAYRLEKAGIRNFSLLELEAETGGNSSSGKNAISAYPWGAHYVPLLTEEATAVHRLFKELGVITGADSKGLPVYNEYYLCGDPHERLYIDGRWQEGLVPTIGITAEEDAQYKKFFALMEEYKKARGNDGRKAFAIPVDRSSADPAWRKLDTLTMLAWMEQSGFTEKRLQWYVNYCCRDDFGTTLETTSAWAGLHYFAARSGKAANTDSQGLVTWPEGNGWLAHQLRKPVQEHVIPQALVYKVARQDGKVLVDYWDSATERSHRLQARAVLMATPQFIAARLLTGGGNTGYADAFSYAPWAIANISLDQLPHDKNVGLAWDNMIYKSNLLGYVVTTHQVTQMKPLETVLTYYWPLSHAAPKEARTEALNRSLAEWQDIFTKELLAVHPDLKGHIRNVDICVWGHAMVRPTPGFIWGDARRAALKQHPPIFRAHSDMSGISIFEEAFTRGIQASEEMLSFLDIPYEPYA